jgi:hypothetical protein
VRSPLLALLFASPLLAAPDPGKSAEAIKALKAALASTPLSELADRDFAKAPLTKADAASARELLWQAHVAFIRKERAQEIKDRVLKEDKLEMPFFYKTFGEKPKGGRSLWISLHGGGGAPAKVNDQQYENQKKLYTVDEGIYLAPRAPTNNWNLWHEPHIDRMFGRLIGALSIVRFRTVVEDTRDTAFVIFAVVVGMAIGAGFPLLAAIGVPAVLAGALLMRWVNHRPSPMRPSENGTLTVRVNAGLDPEMLLGSLFSQHLSAMRLTNTSTAKQGAALEATYKVRLRSPDKAFALISELAKVEGVQGVELKQN